MSLIWKLLDQGWGLALLVVFAAVAIAWVALQIAGEALSKDQRHRRALLAGAALPVFGVVFLICAGLLDRVGNPPGTLILVERGGVVRLASLTTRSGRGGSSCLVRVHELDGAYVGGSAHPGGCSSQIVDGLAIFTVHAGMLWGEADRVFVDLWTGRVRDHLGPRVAAAGLPGAGEYEVLELTGQLATIRAQDGSTRQIPLDGGTGVRSVRLPHVGEPLHRSDLFRAERLPSRCAGPDVQLIAHQSVAFGEGSALLSAVPDPLETARPVWTIDLTALWGDRPVLGVLEVGGDCLLIAGRSNARLTVVRVDGGTGAIESQWTN